MSTGTKMEAVAQICRLIAAPGDVVGALVGLVGPHTARDQAVYRVMVEHGAQIRFEVAPGWARTASQFQVVIETGLPMRFRVILPPIYGSAEALAGFSATEGRDFTDLTRLRHVLGIVFQMVASRPVALLQALRGAFGFLPGEVGFYVSTEDYCGDAETATLSRRKGEGNLLLPDPFYFTANAYEGHKQRVVAAGKAWAERLDSVLWRGSTTGKLVTAGTLFENRRVALAAYCADYPEIFDVKLTNVVQMAGEEAEEARRILADKGLLAGWMDMGRFAEHKFALHIDGNASAAGFFEKLSLGCCVLRVASDYEQWFEPRLEPWVHYVPIAEDFGDLREKAGFLLANPSLAEKIAQAGFDFAVEADQHHEAGLFVHQLAASLNVRRISLTLTAPGAGNAGWQGESLERSWHGLEPGANEQPFRWTKSRETTWAVNLEASANSMLSVAVSLAGPVAPPFADGCKIRLGGRVFPLSNAGWNLTAEIPIEQGGVIREVTLVTPALFRPSEVNGSADTRQLGLPIKAG